jgi:hypothetical protein
MLAVLVAQPSCELSKSCTEIGCIDQATLSFRTPDGAWPDGVYTLALTIDGQLSICELQLPEDFPDTGSVGVLDCGHGVQLQIAADYTCTEHRDDDSVSQSCTAIPDRWLVSVTLPGTPGRVALDAQRDGVQLDDEERELEYRTMYPNGPECDPGCRQTSEEFVLGGT